MTLVAKDGISLRLNGQLFAKCIWKSVFVVCQKVVVPFVQGSCSVLSFVNNF